MTAIGSAMEDIGEEMAQLLFLSNPYTAERRLRLSYRDREAGMFVPEQFIGTVYYIKPSNHNIVLVRGKIGDTYYNVALLNSSHAFKYLSRETNNYDLSYLDIQYDRLYFRREYDSVEVTYGPDSTHDTNYIVVSSDIKSWYVWNYLDEYGLKVNLDRNGLEPDLYYSMRLADVYINPANNTGWGLTHAVARELGLMIQWGEVRVPVLFGEETEDQVGNAKATNIPYVDPPAIIKYYKLQEEELKKGSIIPTVKLNDARSLAVVYQIGTDNYLQIRPTPDALFVFPCIGDSKGVDSTADYTCTKSDLWDRTSSCSIESVWNQNGVAEHTWACYIIEYRNRVEQAEVMDSTSRTYLPRDMAGIIDFLRSSNWEINDPDYKAAHWPAWDGVAEYDEFLFQIYISGLDFTVATTEGTSYALGMEDGEWRKIKLGYSQMELERSINKRMAVFWGYFSWDRAFVWPPEGALESGVEGFSPGLERGLEYLPALWDGRFAQ